MIRNLDRALLYLFSSVSVEIADVFLGLDGFPCWKSSFSKILCCGTLYLLSVSECRSMWMYFWNWFSAFYRPSSVLRKKFGRFDELLSVFHAEIGKSLSHHRQCFRLFMYAVTSSMNMNESDVNIRTYRLVSVAERIQHWSTEPATRDRFPVRVFFLLLFNFFGNPGGQG
jgi:hypothetical protein